MSPTLAQRGPQIRLGTLTLAALGTAALIGGVAVVPDLLSEEGFLPSDVGNAAPLGYTITYRIESGDTVTTQVLSVRRPFGSRLSLHAGDDPEGWILSERASDLGVLATSSGGPWGHIVVPPALASADLRTDAVLDAAVETGLFEDLGEGSVGGRPCHRYRAASSLGGGTLAEPTPGEHADVCIDAAGLLLEEEWTVDGEVAITKRAVALDLDLPRDGDLVVPDGDEVPGSGDLREIGDDDPPFAVSADLEVLPEGFEHVGRYAVVPPDLTPDHDPLAPPSAATVATITDVWVRGADVIVLDQGATTAELPFPRSEVAAPADIGGFDAEVVLDLRATEVRIVLGDGGFVRVSATLPPDEVVALAQSLQFTKGDVDA
jgi:hypothetical protein